MVPLKIKSLQVRIPVHLHRKVKIAAAQAGRSVQEVVIDALLAVVEPQDNNLNPEATRP